MTDRRCFEVDGVKFVAVRWAVGFTVHICVAVMDNPRAMRATYLSPRSLSPGSEVPLQMATLAPVSEFAQVAAEVELAHQLLQSMRR